MRITKNKLFAIQWALRQWTPCEEDSKERIRYMHALQIETEGYIVKKYGWEDYCKWVNPKGD